MMNSKVADTSAIDKWDVAAAIASGTVSAGLDFFWMGDLSLVDAHKWGTEKAEDFVIKVACSNYVSSIAVANGKKPYKGTDHVKAIAFLEELFPHTADKLTNDIGGGYNHHLRDFCHHPTIIGLLFSILSQFTKCGFGTDVHGNFICLKITDKSLIGQTIPEKIYLGTIGWAFHLISDMAGSSSSAFEGKEGTGIPGPLMATLKELSSLPCIKKICKDKDGYKKFSVTCSKLFNGTLLGEHENGHIVKGTKLKFDLRTEMGIVNEAIDKKQYIPVVINEVIVRAFYSIRRFYNELKTVEIESVSDLSKLNPYAFLPWNSKSLSTMLLISSTSFSVIEISAAGIKAAVKNPKNKSGFALDFLQGINYCGIGRVALAVNSITLRYIGELQSKFVAIAKKQISRINILGMNGDEISTTLTQAVSEYGAIVAIGTPIGFISATIGVYQQISEALKELNIAREDRIRIEAECTERITVIKANREEMEQCVSAYMSEHLMVFSEALDEMDVAMENNDTDGFIGGNAKIQKNLGRDSTFSNQSEFEDLMSNGDSFKM